ncbi:MAG: hypothetical protein ACRDI1_11765 [Actinomycetota bacterium]
MADDSEANSWLPAGWHELGWPWDLTSSYLRFLYLEDFPRTDAHIAEALDALRSALVAKTSEPRLEWWRPLEDMLPAGMWTAWGVLLPHLVSDMPRLSSISEAGVRRVAREFAPRAAIPPEIARRVAPDLMTGWLGYLSSQLATDALHWAEDALRERRGSPQLTSYMELVSEFAPLTEEKGLRYSLIAGLGTTGRESALPYLERLTAPEFPAAVRTEAELQAQIVLNDFIKDSEGGWI